MYRLTWRLPLAGLVAFSHLQFSQIRGRQPYSIVRKIPYLILQLGLLVNGADTGVVGLDNKTSMIGQSLPLGHAIAGDALTFVLKTTDGDIIKKAYSDPTMNVSYDIDVHADTSMYIRRPQLRGFLASHREAIDCDAK